MARPDSTQEQFQFSFKVTYDMEAGETEKDLEIAVGVLSAFAVIWAAMETWSWSRRSGKLAVDPWTLAHLVVRTCGALAHTFFTVIFFTCLYWFAFFKQQSYLHVLLPSPQVWLPTQFYSVDFLKSRIDVKKCVFNKRTIKVCVSCC